MASVNRVYYNDLYFRLILSLIAAHIIVIFGADESFFQLLVSWFYWRDLALSFVIAYFLISEIYLATIKLDRRFDWRDETVPRIGLQLLFGLVVPSLSAFLLATAYFALFGFNIFKTDYLQFDFPVIVILLLLLNVYYLAFYFFRRWQQLERKGRSNNDSEADNEDDKQGRKVIIAKSGTDNVPLKVDDICYFYHSGGFNFARTFEREDYVISPTLDEIQKQISERQFFRVSRQMIVNFKACEHFKPIASGKLELFVNPPAKEPVIISQKRVKPFREWIER